MLIVNALTMNGGRDERSQLGDLHSEKAFTAEEVSFPLTVKDGGLMLFGPTASVEPAGGGIACSQA